MEVYLENVVKSAVIYMEHAQHKTVSAMDVVNGGFDVYFNGHSNFKC